MMTDNKRRYIPKGDLPIRKQNKPFLVWDGEGVTDAQNCSTCQVPGSCANEQHYVLFGHTGDQVPGFITGRNLRTDALLDFLYSEAVTRSNFIHVSFGFGYDVDQILKDVPAEYLERLLDKNEVLWEDWKITYYPRKFFKLKRRGAGQPEITVFDTISFFHGSLIAASMEYIPDHPLLQRVLDGKNLRGGFQYSDLGDIILPYWKIEGDLMVALMDALRYSMRGAKIELSSWHGPGAVANALIKTNRLGRHLETSRDEMPAQVTEATSYAFFGGRFECHVIGHIQGPIYSYDIRSAYPAALSKMPGLSGGQWDHEYEPEDISQWGLYRYSYNDTSSEAGRELDLGPLPNRYKDGTVSYGLSGAGWSYGHEILAARHSGFTITVHEGWTYGIPGKPESHTPKPFWFLNEQYVKRAEYKKANNPAQLALKLSINSVYGKLAQTVGWDEDTMKPPRYHQQWYAGQTTSWCRAMIQYAIGQVSPDNIIAIETDGIYSKVPLAVQEGPHLGLWESKVYDEMYYVQSGFYAIREGDTWTLKVRGMDASPDKQDGILRTILGNLSAFTPIQFLANRYGSFTGHIGRRTLHTWFTEPRSYQWGGGGKRYHDAQNCPGCRHGEMPHITRMTRPYNSFSHPRSLPWEEGDQDHPAWGVWDSEEIVTSP